MSLSVQAGTTNRSAVSQSGSGSGSDAQRAYVAATKDLKDAQEQLGKDTADKKGEDTLKVDQAAVQMAQAALASAAAAVARENADAQQATARNDETGSPSSQSATREIPAPDSASVIVDLYT